MTSFRQIEANRRNALRSTGPNTDDGKRRSRQNAIRHGLCAETVIEIVEDVDDYSGFEAAVIADYDARTAVERELVAQAGIAVVAPAPYNCDRDRSATDSGRDFARPPKSMRAARPTGATAERALSHPRRCDSSGPALEGCRAR